MGQIHKRFTNEQIRFLFGAYVHGHIKRIDVQEALAIGKSRFFELLREYWQASETLSVSYERSTPPRLSPTAEAAIKAELLREKDLVEDPRLPISGYNYSALRDRLRKTGIHVSAATITARAKTTMIYTHVLHRGGLAARRGQPSRLISLPPCSEGPIISPVSNLQGWPLLPCRQRFSAAERRLPTSSLCTPICLSSARR